MIIADVDGNQEQVEGELDGFLSLSASNLSFPVSLGPVRIATT